MLPAKLKAAVAATDYYQATSDSSRRDRSSPPPE